MFAVLEFSDYAVIVFIVSLFAGGGAYLFSQPPHARRLVRLERKLDAILKHLNIEYVEPPSGLSEEARRLADKQEKIAAIKLHREETGLGLKEAKDAVEAYMSGRS